MTEPDQVEFHEQVSPGGRSLPLRMGIVAGAAALFIVGAVAAMGASPSPATTADPGAGATPGTTTTPNGTTAPNAVKPDQRGPGGPGVFGFRGGDFGRIGFGDITISAISGSNVSLKTDDGWTRTIAVTGTTKISKGGATIAVGDLAVGDQIHFAETKDTDGTFTVTAINVILPTVVGQVSAISGSTITVTQPGGTTMTIHVGGSTTYQVDGATGALSDLKVGAFIVAEGTQRTDGSLDAAAVRSGFRDGRGFGGPGPGGPGFPHQQDGQKGPNATPAPSTSAG